MTPLKRLARVLTLRCEGASRLASQAMDEPLPWPERLALSGHLLACAHCRRFRRQLQAVRDLARAPRPERGR